MAFVGQYNPATTYSIGDTVSYLGGYYTAIQITTGNLPSDGTFWTADSAIPDIPANQLPEKITDLVAGDKVLLSTDSADGRVKQVGYELFVGPQGPPGPIGCGDMEKSIYDPNLVEADAFDSVNHYYDNLVSDLSADNVQDATDELTAKVALENGGVVTIPTITDNLDGTISVGTDGLYNFYKNSDGTNGIEQMTIDTPLLSQALTDLVINFVYVDYNGGNPIFGVTTNGLAFLQNADWSLVFNVYRTGNELHITNYDNYGTALSSKALYKDIVLNRFQRQAGLILSTSGTRISTVSAGVAWFGVQLYNLAENISGTVGELEEFYLVAGVWNKTTVTEYDSIYYSDGVDRQTLGVAKYVAKYFYRGIEDDNHVYYTHGQEFNSEIGAVNEAIPVAPGEITSHSIYVGKIVIFQGATLGTAYPRNWDASVSSTGAQNHDDLALINTAGVGILHGHINNSFPLVFPNLTTTQRDAISSPIVSMKIFNTTTGTYQNYDGADWIDDGGGGGGGIDLIYPHDITAGFVRINMYVGDTTTYTVPVGKVLYIQHASSGSATKTLSVSGVDVMRPRYNASNGYTDFAIPLILEAGEVVSSNVIEPFTSTNIMNISGFLCDANVNVEPIYSSTSYTVPVGKKFILNQLYTSAILRFTIEINSLDVIFTQAIMNAAITDVSMNSIHNPIILNAGDVLNSEPVAFNFFGYLIPDNFSI